ncbi:MAG TPA: transcription termination/antitermination protein NusA [Ghiorsea sp.]|nr:transcription termination/antitermination protein NusA [Ghiorsea sp.]HIP07461.1 transcription termination/antitermination protein NusA [Mariprofundaceae bacterium]
MNADMLAVADAVAREKSVERELVLESMEQALKTAARRTYGTKVVEANIDRLTGELSLFHVRTVVDEVEDEENELTLEQGKAIDENASVDYQFREPLAPIELDRVAAQTAKQVINQKIREAERAQVVAEYEPRVGEIVVGIVKRVERGNVYVELGRGEGVMYREDLLPRESFRQGDRVRTYLREVRNQPKGALVYLSRADAGMVLRLFEQEVPEIQDGMVAIQAISRDPGSRSKIAVISTDVGVDPVGACVGMRGARVQAVVNELHGEKIDIIEWTEDPAAFVVNALAPAEVERVLVDEDTGTIEVAVAEDQLAIAIGRRGQNVRLASELTGWKVEIMTLGDEKEKRAAEIKAATEAFIAGLDIDEDFSVLLIGEGFMSLSDLAYCNLEELTAIEGLEAELAEELQKRARDGLLNSALKEEGDDEPLIALMDVEGMTAEIAEAFTLQGLVSANALADAASDEIEPIEGLEEEVLNTLIIAAREACGWFKD